MNDSTEFASEKRNDIWNALNKVTLDLLDPYRAYDELNITTPNLSFADHFTATEENLDEFDWTGIAFENYNEPEHSYVNYTRKPAEKSMEWAALCQHVEQSIANGFLLDTEPVETRFTPYVNPLYSRMPVSSRREPKQDIQKLLRQWDRLPANTIDILSPYDSVFESGHRLFNSFEMNVPLKIYSQDEEFVVKADPSDIVFNMKAAGETGFPEQLNFKSVLALLPDRINARQLQPTFVDGQFRLELPKREEEKNTRVK